MASHCDSGNMSLLSMDAALAVLLDDVQVIRDIDWLPLKEACGRVLALRQTASVAVPPMDNSAMDGYAVNSRDLHEGKACGFVISQHIAAGYVGTPLKSGTVAHIATGAPLPSGADAVVMQERCRLQGDRVWIPDDIKAGANVRRAGEDISLGGEILPAGIRLRPQDIGLAASVGLAQLPVYRRLRVALLSTGDELVEPGLSLQAPGKIYNSNRYTIYSLLQALGCEVIDLGCVPDTFDATCDALINAAREADVILTSGGVSMGARDYIKQVIDKLGNMALWRIAIKPGKPLAFGRMGDTPFIGLPGNPVASFVTFCIFVRPYLLRCQGLHEIAPAQWRLPAAFDWPHPDKRREFLRARLQWDTECGPQATLFSHQGSGVLSSTVWADGLVIVRESQAIRAGDPIDFLPFSGLFI